MGKATGGVPKADDIHTLVLWSQTVDDAIRTANHFPYILLSKFRHNTADFGKTCKVFCAGNQFKTEPGGCVRIMSGNITDDISADPSLPMEQ